MCDEDRLLFPPKIFPDDFKDHTAEIIWRMRIGYRRHYGIIEQPPVPIKPKSKKIKSKCEMKIQNWKSVNELPEIPRGEMEECWVAVSFELQDYSKYTMNTERHYLPAENKVLKLRWLNAALTTEEADFYEEEGELPETSPARLSDWTNEDGDHSNYTGWVEWIGGEESYYRYAIPNVEKYISGGNWAGRFKILAWTPEERPEFPSEFSPSVF